MSPIAVSDAVKSARDYLTQLYEGKAQEILLEEVQRGEDRDRPWEVTLSFTIPSVDSPVGHTLYKQLTDPLGLSASGYPRHYKVLVIDASTGEARAMKIRKV